MCLNYVVIRMNSILRIQTGPRIKGKEKVYRVLVKQLRSSLLIRLIVGRLPFGSFLIDLIVISRALGFIWAPFGWAFLVNDFIYSRESTLGASSNS